MGSVLIEAHVSFSDINTNRDQVLDALRTSAIVLSTGNVTAESITNTGEHGDIVSVVEKYCQLPNVCEDNFGEIRD